jgi:ferredoxin-thioredoxin reductase catalytic subunit
MVEYMKQYIDENNILNAEEMMLLSNAYKNYLGIKRKGYQNLLSIQNKEKNNPTRSATIAEYINAQRTFIKTTVEEIINIIDEKLYLNAPTLQCKVQYTKMKADYYRYICECYTDDSILEEYKLKCKLYYELATNLALGLTKCDPIRLGVALNFSVFNFEILKNKDVAYQIVTESFDAALAEMDTVDDQHYKSFSVLLQSLKEKMVEWMKPTQSPPQAEKGM